MSLFHHFTSQAKIQAALVKPAGMKNSNFRLVMTYTGPFPFFSK